MKITEVRIYQKDHHDKKLRAFSTITFDDCFVVRDIKIIEGSKGLFVAMPSRRMKDACHQCRHQNVVRSVYCNQCGASLKIPQPTGQNGHNESMLRQNEHKDIAHPITAEFREYIQKEVLAAYEKDQSQPNKEEHKA